MSLLFLRLLLLLLLTFFCNKCKCKCGEAGGHGHWPGEDGGGDQVVFPGKSRDALNVHDCLIALFYHTRSCSTGICSTVLLLVVYFLIQAHSKHELFIKKNPEIVLVRLWRCILHLSVKFSIQQA